MHGPHKQALLVFAVFLLSYGYFGRAVTNANENTRLGLVFSVVHEGRLTIDSYHDTRPTATVDKAFYEGHYFSDKAPGTSLIGILAYAPMHALAQAFGSEPSFERVRYVIRFFASSLPSALAAALVYLCCLPLTGESFRSFVYTLSVALGSLVFPYSTLSMGHSLAAACLFTSFFMILSLARGWRSWHHGYLAGLGFLMGFTFLAEYTTLPVLAALCAYYLGVAARDGGLQRSARWLAPLAGGLAPCAVYLGYNWLCFGSPLANAYGHMASEDMTALHDHGVYGVSWPRASTLYYLTFHPVRGLFVQSPVLLLGVAGLVFMWKRRWRVEAALVTFALAIFLLMNAGLTLWWGGHTVGPRYLIAPLLLLALPLCFLPKRSFPIVVIAAGISVFHMLLVTAGEPTLPDYRLKAWIEAGVSPLPYFSSSPIYFEELDFIARAGLAPNLGTRIGLASYNSVLPLLIVIAWAGAWLRTRPDQPSGIEDGECS